MIRTLSSLLSSLALLFGLCLGPALASAETVTILLKLQPKKANGHNWDIGPGADPVLCVEETCYRSHGPGRPATPMSRARMLGPFVAMNVAGKAGACTNKTACVFRGVELPDDVSPVRPIDIDVEAHDRMEERFVTVDRTCDAGTGALACYRGTHTVEYSMWIVPETLAATLPAVTLQAALGGDMDQSRLAYAEEFLGEEHDAMPSLVADFFAKTLEDTVDPACAGRSDTMMAAFELAGIADGSDPRFNAFLSDYLADPTRAMISRSIVDQPREFWRLNEAIGRLHQISGAREVRLERARRGIFLDGAIDERRPVLVVGYDVSDRARKLIDRCEGRSEMDLSSLVKRNGS
ncbi:MAG: hypothetical protein R3D33_14165 [Hyphomicrobiaceae bacterium]